VKDNKFQKINKLMKDIKINKQILQKESINSDGQQLYQYQQDKQ
jgi:hypothetical protein